MKDQKIYAEIARLLFNEAPDISSEIHALVLHFEKSPLMTAWTGELMTLERGFVLSGEAQMKLSSLLNSLKEHYIENNMGDWNIVHCVAIPSLEKFELEVDFCEDLEKDKITFSEYAMRFFGSSRLHNRSDFHKK